MSQESGALSRENCFDFIRLVAALSVVVAHGVMHFDAPFLVIPAGTDVLHEGKEGVRVFFVLSGLLVFMSALKCFETGRSIKSFFVNRWLRVAPAIYAYALVITVVLVLIGAISVSSVTTKTHLAWLAGNFVLYPMYYPPEHRHIGVGVLNGSLWTIPVEVMYYLVVPLLALWWFNGKRSLVGWTLALAALGGVAVLDIARRRYPGWFDGSQDEALWFKVFFSSLPPWLYWFALGIAWYRWWPRAPKGTAWFICALAAYVLLAFVFYAQMAPLGAYREVLYGIPLSYAVIWFGYHGPAALRDLSKIGDMSYGVYVWHMVVINLMLYFGLKDSWPKALLVPAAMLFTVIIAWLSWWLIEKPSLRRKPYTSRGVTR